MTPHGYVDINWQGNLIIIHSHGPFNLEGISMAYEQMKQSVREQDFEQWYRIDYLDDATLGSPNVMEVIGKSYKWSGPYNQCMGVAVYCSTNLQETMMHHLATLLPFDVGVFTSLDNMTKFLEKSKWGVL